jgi:hypothetical protein
VNRTKEETRRISGAFFVLWRLCGCEDQPKNRGGLRDQSKRDSSTAWRGSFAGAIEKEKAAPFCSE